MSFTNRESNVWRRRTSTLCLIFTDPDCLHQPHRAHAHPAGQIGGLYPLFTPALPRCWEAPSPAGSCAIPVWVTVVASLLAVCMAFFFAYVVELR